MRQFLSALVARAVLGTVVFLGWRWLDDALLSAQEPGSTPEATVAAYLEAWEAGDHLAMALLVRSPPDRFTAVHQQLADALEPDRLQAVAGEPVEPVDGRALVPVAVTLTGAHLGGEVSWDTELELVRERGEWGVVWTPAAIHPDLEAGLVFDLESEPVQRAPILAADGTELASQGDVVTFGFEPTAVTDPDGVVEVFEEALPGSGATAERLLGRSDLVDGWFYPVVTVSAQRADDASPILRRAAGILRRTQSGRALYADNFAIHVVGRVAEATAEQLEQLGEPYEVGDHVGQFGLERQFERSLVGSDLVRIVLRDGPGGSVRMVVSEHQDDPSGPLHTTLDVTVQRAIENALIGVDGDVAIVVVDPDSGALLGSASLPLTGFNRALEGRYAPGSTFKIVTAEALLAAGATVDDLVACPAETTVGGLAIRNAGGRGLGEVSLLEAFFESCNTSFAALAAAEGTDTLTAAAERFGFGVEPLIPLSSFGGSFPVPQDTAELGAAAFGQGRVEVSPLHLATIAAAAATGVWHQPYLLADDGPGESRQLAPGTLDTLRRMMRAVVTQGTGRAADVPGAEVYGKTGTAQAQGGVEHAWFAGFWRDYAFAILVEDGGGGGAVAAPLGARLVQELTALLDGVTDETDDATESEPDDAVEHDDD